MYGPLYTSPPNPLIQQATRPDTSSCPPSARFQWPVPLSSDRPPGPPVHPVPAVSRRTGGTGTVYRRVPYNRVGSRGWVPPEGGPVSIYTIRAVFFHDFTLGALQKRVFCSLPGGEVGKGVGRIISIYETTGIPILPNPDTFMLQSCYNLITI